MHMLQLVSCSSAQLPRSWFTWAQAAPEPLTLTRDTSHQHRDRAPETGQVRSSDNKTKCFCWQRLKFPRQGSSSFLWRGDRKRKRIHSNYEVIPLEDQWAVQMQESSGAATGSSLFGKIQFLSLELFNLLLDNSSSFSPGTLIKRDHFSWVSSVGRDCWCAMELDQPPAC